MVKIKNIRITGYVKTKPKFFESHIQLAKGDIYCQSKIDKIKNAIERGFENDSTVIADMQSHHKVLAESFFYEKKITTPQARWIVPAAISRERKMNRSVLNEVEI